MPELPEVETVVRRLRSHFIDQRLAALWCNWPRILSPAARTIERALVGSTVREIVRRAKYAVFRFDPGGWLLMHLRMSGRPTIESCDARPAKHVHFVLKFESGLAMHLEDARKFGRVRYTRDLAAAVSGLGIEPLSEAFTPAWLADALRARRRRLKPALLDQSFIAGLGNIYTDEALHRARLHPLRATDSLRRGDAERLHEAVRAVLEAGIRSNGASIDWVYPGGEMQMQFEAYGRAGEPCRRCGARIVRLVVGQRGTHVCPRCQRAPRGLNG